MGYIEVAGRRTWHEISGTGEPVVLLHGGLSGALSFAAQTPDFVAAGFRVYVPERRGHGHTPDADEPMSYAAMAGETIAYLDQVVRDAAPLVGWSDGAVVALLVAMRRPDLVARLVLIGQYFNSSGRIEGGIADLLIGDPGVKEYLRSAHAAESPDGPGQFDVFFDRCLAMWAAEPEIALSEIAGVRAPTLVLQGDRDDVRLEHSVQVAAALPAGRLAVLPGTHLLPVESPAVVNALILSFLRSDPT